MPNAQTPPPNGPGRASEPDALEVLRASRGEGWQWPRIQYEPCPQCGFDPSSIPPEELGGLAVELAAGWREFLEGADEGYLRAIPEPGVNSPLQYGAHVRDILMVYGERMVLAKEQDNPTVPIFNPPQEVWEAYNRLEVEDLAADIEARATRLAEIVEGTENSQWSRIVINDRGQYGVYTFTVAGLARNSVHEAHHHLLDAKGTLFTDAST
ncbi:MAG: DinB family protein [Acidimicrobiales bacterium]